MELVLFWLVFAVVAGVIAASKGRSGLGYFVLSVLLSPVVGLILAVALPRVQRVVAVPGPGDIDSGARTPCPNCAELVLPAAKVCRFCGHRLKVD
jgi:hypothetical protein